MTETTTPADEGTGYYERVKCPECELVQKARSLNSKTESHRCEQCGHQITIDEWETVYTDDREEVICPHCGCEVAFSMAFGEPAECTDEETECDECDMPFLLTCVGTTEYTTRTDCELIGKTHQWQESSAVKNLSNPSNILMNCTKCDMDRWVKSG